MVSAWDAPPRLTQYEPMINTNQTTRNLHIEPAEGDFDGLNHVASVSTTGDKRGNATTLVTFTATVTMGQELYAEWQRNKFKLPEVE